MNRFVTQHTGKTAAAALIFAASLLIPAYATGSPQNSGSSTTAPDNSAQNRGQHTTADQQSNRRADLAMTRKIRRSVVSDKTLSTYAHNVKIITRNGVVTLKGPVASEQEKQTVASKAEAVAGSTDKVNNQLTVDNSGK